MRVIRTMHHREPQWRSGLMLLAALDVTTSQGIPLQPLPRVPRTMAVEGMVRGRTEAKSRSSPRPIESLLKPIHLVMIPRSIPSCWRAASAPWGSAERTSPAQSRWLRHVSATLHPRRLRVNRDHGTARAQNQSLQAQQGEITRKSGELAPACGVWDQSVHGVEENCLVGVSALNSGDQDI